MGHVTICPSFSVCLKGVKIHRKCYLVDPVRKGYHAASEDCSNLGADVGTPASSSENEQLRDYIRQSISPGEQVWLGVNDMVKEGAWVDHTGANITYKNWDTSNSLSPQPDGGQSKNCAVLSGASGLTRTAKRKRPLSASSTLCDGIHFIADLQMHAHGCFRSVFLERSFKPAVLT